MKKKIICLLFAIILVTLTACGSKTGTEDFAFEPYTAFEDLQTSELLLDVGITLDGVLDEEIWTVNTPTKLRGVTGEDIDVTIYGARSAEVYTYIGEKNVYFAFDVKDKNLYFDAQGTRSSSTCVEIYFANGNTTQMGDGCYSIRVNPTGKEENNGASAKIYVSNVDKNGWRLSSEEGMYAAAAKVDGKVCSSPNDSSYSTKKNKGYVVEIAVSKTLLGKDVQSIRYTAAFVQDKGFSLPRLGNSFISGTTYNNPNTWVIKK